MRRQRSLFTKEEEATDLAWLDCAVRLFCLKILFITLKLSFANGCFVPKQKTVLADLQVELS